MSGDKVLVLLKFIGLLYAVCAGSMEAGELTLLRKVRHDPRAFTQGLCISGNIMYESTGMYGESTLKAIRLETMEVLASKKMPDDIFAEGLTYLDGKLYQLTWKSGQIRVYEAESLKLSGRLQLPLVEGWGLTTDGERLLASDGTATLSWLDAKTGLVISTLKVLDRGKPVRALNELEWIGGEIWANVWKTDEIVRIDAKNGEVLGWVDIAPWLENLDWRPQADVLNGIAWDASSGEIYLTGKYFPLTLVVHWRP